MTDLLETAARGRAVVLLAESADISPEDELVARGL